MTLSRQLGNRWLISALFACLFVAFAAHTHANVVGPYGLETRRPSRSFLQMPNRADGHLPRLLSQTGAFKDTQSLTPDASLIPYDLNVSFWSDGASKTRFVSLPQTRIHFTSTGEWFFPEGTVFVKTFELATNEAHPEFKRRLETRLIVRDSSNGVYGVTYKWRPDNDDADLLETNLAEPIAIQTAGGIRITQMWYYPSRADCLTCHTPLSGGVLGPKTRQLNGRFTYPSGVTDNQLRAWNHIGLFDTNLNETALHHFPALAKAMDTSRTLEDRARSYLDANCAHCHRPGGTVAYFDARYDTPLANQDLIGGRVLIDQRIDNSRVIAPNDIWRSILYLRANTTEAFKMPPLARNMIDEKGMSLLRKWIESFPGPSVLPPPEISPRGGNFPNPLEVTLKAEPGASIRYTLDGTVPTPSDLLYEKPIRLNGPAIVRAKAFKPGLTKSITSQEIFLIGQ